MMKVAGRILLWLIPSVLVSGGNGNVAGAVLGESTATRCLAHNALSAVSNVPDEVDYTVERVVERDPFRFVQLSATFRGHPILEFGTTVVVDPDCRVVTVAGRLEEFGTPDAPAIPPERAGQIASTVYEWRETKPVVEGLSLRLVGQRGVWMYRVRSGERAMLVNASTGIIDRAGAYPSHGVGSSSSATGLGQDGVLSPPLTDKILLESVASDPVGNVFYREPGHSPFEPVPLPRLLGDGRSLDGKYARTTSYRKLGSIEPFRLPDDAEDFRFEPNLDPDEDCRHKLEDCSLFDLVNLYYHLDRFADEYWAARMRMEIDFQVLAIAHVEGDVIFVRGDTIQFGIGDLYVKNTALSDDFIYHEYTHVVFEHVGFVVDRNATVQKRALGEGYADYFSASYTGDPQFGEWVVTCPPRQHCEGPENDTSFRIPNTDPVEWNWNFGDPDPGLKYGVCARLHEEDTKCKITWNNYGDLYPWGMIWGGTLWDLREAVGPDVADELILAGVLMWGGSMNGFDLAGGALISADRLIYGGEHEAIIRAILANRGIMPTVSALDEPEGDPTDEFVIESVYPNPTDGDVAIEASSDGRRVISIRVVDVLGREIARIAEGVRPQGRVSYRYGGEALPAGLYIVEAESGGRRVMASFVHRR